MVNFRKLDKPKLLHLLEDMQQRLVSGVGDDKRLVHELQQHRNELDSQNRELRETQQALEAARDRYADLYEFAPVGYLTLDRKGRIVEGNLTAANLLGQERQSLEDQPLAACLNGIEASMLSPYLRKLFTATDTSNQAQRIQLTTQSPDGAARPRRLLMECHVVHETAARDADAGGARCLCALLDVTAQRLIEEELYRQQERYRTVVETASDGFLMLDPQGHVSAVNEAYLQRSGYGRDELGQMSIADLEAKESSDEVETHLAKVKRLGNDRFETLHRAKSGETWPVEVSVAFSELAGERFFVFARDISERRRLEQEIIAASTMEQERIGREIHDGIGQQLSGLTMMAEAVKQDLLDAGLSAEAKSVADLLEHLQTALEDARLLARGLSPLQIDTQGLADALEVLTEQIRKTTGVECHYRGASTFSFGGHVSALHLYRVAQEGVHNALTHGHPQRIEIDLREKDGLIVLDVLDDGDGIPAEHERGNGLGLRIMQYRADIMNGTCMVQCAEGSGTLVRCTVPLDQDTS